MKRIFTIHFATINTLALVLLNVSSLTFTIHFATINTVISEKIMSNIINLHYTLLLLIQKKNKLNRRKELIYITLCYY